MCSIYGIVFFNEPDQRLLRRNIEIMQAITIHRGPDCSEKILLKNAGIGMNRLKIVGLDETASIHRSVDNSNYAVFNGEIVNHQALKNELVWDENLKRNDGSVILPLYNKYGKAFINKLAGMFSIAIYDKNNNTLSLWRDPLGIKPLYYYYCDEFVAFSSEIKSIYSFLDEKPEINLSAINNILRFRLNPGDTTVFNKIHKVLPGQNLFFDSNKKIAKKYWSLPSNENILSEYVNHNDFKDLFVKVLSEYFSADVKGGIFTSGGLDSSLLTSIALQSGNIYSTPICLRFKPSSVDDENYCKILEDYLNTKFEWVTITDNIARQTIFRISPYLDEPLENPTHIGTFLMAERAKELGIKSIITGDGSDEFFLGYDRHECWFKYENPTAIYPSLHWTLNPGDSKELYFPDVLQYFEPMKNGYNEIIEPFTNMPQALIYEREERLPEYHNMRLDRMTMAFGVEARVPYLDHRIVEYSLKIPIKLHFNNIRKSWLKKLAIKWLPDDIIFRQKKLFPSLPNQWLMGKGSGWIADILLDPNAFNRNLMKTEVIEKFILDHSCGNKNRGRLLWALGVLELWYNNLQHWKNFSKKFEPV